MTNSAEVVQFLKADWEAQRIAFELAKSSDLSIIPVTYPAAAQASLEFGPTLEDPADSTPDRQSPPPSRE